MNTELLVEPRDKYGETRIYPKCDKSRLFCQMLNQKTLTPRDIHNIIRLGFTIKAEHPPITFGATQGA
jgi:hypothetical protein